mmetsp:Transcript_26324/g.73948  ORF Transcript_26324/g.73948 Transcript_26324/m.73948 type:complete len:203 (-) Transcript_26324:102-710(-)
MSRKVWVLPSLISGVCVSRCSPAEVVATMEMLLRMTWDANISTSSSPPGSLARPAPPPMPNAFLLDSTTSDWELFSTWKEGSSAATSTLVYVGRLCPLGWGETRFLCSGGSSEADPAESWPRSRGVITISSLCYRLDGSLVVILSVSVCFGRVVYGKAQSQARGPCVFPPGRARGRPACRHGVPMSWASRTIRLVPIRPEAT